MLTFIRKSWQIILLVIFFIVAVILGSLYFFGGKDKTNKDDVAIVKNERSALAKNRKAQILASADSVRQRDAFVCDSLKKDSIKKSQVTVNCGDQVVKGNYSAPNGYDVTLTMKAPKYGQRSNGGSRQTTSNYRPKPGPSWGNQTRTQTTDVPENAFKNTFKSTTATTTPAITETRTSSEVIVPGRGNLAITVYTGGLEGPACTSIDKQGHLIYAIKAEGVNAANASIAPELNYVGGPKFTLDPNQGWWFCVDMNRLVSVQEINNDNSAVEWGVYIGKVTSGNYTYENWLPHAWTKGTLKAARGKEWGEITPADLIKMHAIDPNIWTESTGGTIKFFAPGDTGGKVLSPDDHNSYYGAKFHTRIYGQRILTRTIN